MTNLYQKFKKLNKEEVLDIGQYYSVDKEGFAKFLEETWNEEKENTCDFARALITVVALLNDRPLGSEHEITVINDFFNDTQKEKNRIINALDKYFNEARVIDGGYDIVKAYKEKVSAREEFRTLFDELQALNFSNIKSIFTPERIQRLKKLNNTYAYVTTIINGVIKEPKKLKKIFVKGNDVNSLILKVGNVNFRFVGAKRGIYNISNDQNELMFQNNVSYNKRYTPMEKIAYVYGIDEAKKFFRDRVHEMTDVQDEIYHKNRKDHKSLEKYYNENV